MISGVQRAHVVTGTELTGEHLDARLEELCDRIRASDNGRRRRSTAALTTALLGGTFQLGRAKDTGRWAGGINTLTSVFVAGFNALAPGSDGVKSDARKFEDEIARYAPLVIAFHQKQLGRDRIGPGAAQRTIARGSACARKGGRVLPFRCSDTISKSMQ